MIRLEDATDELAYPLYASLERTSGLVTDVMVDVIADFVTG